MPFAYDLTLNGSARYTHYKSYGGDHTYKIGGQYSPVKWLSFRGNYGTSYRAPALSSSSLVQPAASLASRAIPAMVTTLPAPMPTGCQLRKRGASVGLPATSGIRVLTAGGAESGLEAETSKSWSVGGVLQPNFGSYGDLSLAVDYFRVQVDNGVSRAGAGNILNAML